jgi:site-specific DNA recombinase
MLLLIDRVVVTDADVEIRYVLPTSSESEHVRFCHLRKDYFDDPSNALRNEGSAMAIGAGLDGDAKRLASFGQPLAAIAEIAQRCSFEAAAGKLMQHRDNALAIMPVGCRNVDRQRKAVLIDREMDFDALDLLSAVEAVREAGRRRLAGSLTRQLSACGQR